MIITFINITNLKNFGDEIVFGLGKLIALFFLLTIIFCSFNIKQFNRSPIIVGIVILLGLLSIFTTFINMNDFSGELSNLLSPFFALTYWFSAFIFGYIVIKSQPDIIKYANLSFILSLPIISYFYFVVAFYYNSPGTKNYQGINDVYYLLMFLPFIFMMKSNLLKLSGTALVAIALFISTKRTGIIAFVTSILVYYIFTIFAKENKRKNKFVSLLAIVIAGIGFTLLFIYFSDQTGGYLLNRFKTINEDEGSGRAGIWINTINLQLDSNLLGWIIGHGFDSVKKTFVGLSAHNDFLEVLYDYGILGIFLYIAIYVQLFNICKKMYIHNYKYFNSFVISCVILLILSLFSHLIIYPTYFIYLTFFWGITIADFENTKKEKFRQFKLWQLEKKHQNP